MHPHSRGGATSISNAQALCARHDRAKGARVPWDWQLARLAKRRAAYFPPDVSGRVERHSPQHTEQATAPR